MNADQFLNDYFTEFHKVIQPPEIYNQLNLLRDVMLRVRENRGKVILAGNGASASIASHFALDFTKQAKVRSIAFNDASLITAYGNDYGYENWVKKAVAHHGSKGDIAILISSSGRSPNMVNAAKEAQSMGIDIITMTGFASDNPLKLLGDINLWVDTKAYNIIESAHSFWLAAVCDLIIGKSEYGVSDENQ
ncbi:SIS domain-containing protein [Thermodesulfobacteriota bacterium]